jgi:hypothetical protein
LFFPDLGREGLFSFLLLLLGFSFVTQEKFKKKRKEDTILLLDFAWLLLLHRKKQKKKGFLSDVGGASKTIMVK